MAAWTAGAKPYRFPAGSARLLPKGRKMVGDFHYHPRGEAATDRLRVVRADPAAGRDASPCEASFDNSAGNPSNPDPTVDVRWGLESTDEMLNGLVDYVAADG